MEKNLQKTFNHFNHETKGIDDFQKVLFAKDNLTGCIEGLSMAIFNEHHQDVKYEIGQSIIALYWLAKQHGLDLNECVEDASQYLQACPICKSPPKKDNRNGDAC